VCARMRIPEGWILTVDYRRSLWPTSEGTQVALSQAMRARDELRDPWVSGGLLLLAVLSLLAVLLYRSAPQSVEEARARAWSSARPDAFAPQLARARERLRTARAASAAARDSAALLAYSDAAQLASAAWNDARDDDQRTSARAVWAEATLESADILLRMGTGTGLRPDDNDLLREALERTEQVLSAPLDTAMHRHAAFLQTRIQRQLRPGPLEWVPPWRR
jgi:hypothetical protein